MSRRKASRLAWSIVGVAIAGAATSLTIAAVGGAGANGGLLVAIATIALFLVASIVGGLVASRHPSNPIGWILCSFTAIQGVSLVLEGYTEYYLSSGGGSLRVAEAAAWVNNWSYVSAFLTVTLVLLLFPDGHLPSRRWAPALWCCLVGNALFAAGVALDTGPLHEYPEIVNPLGVSHRLASVIGPIGITLTLIALFASAGSVIVRFRRSTGVERQQIKWLAVASVIAAAAMLGAAAIGFAGSDNLANAVIVLGILCIPVAIGVAMLRYRLYDIDRVISKTLVYGSLTVVLGASYVGLVLAGQALFSAFAGGSNLAIAVSTLAVAALFLPARSRVQRFVDRRFYRRRYDAQKALEAFGTRLREQIDLGTLSGDLRTAVDETMQPAHVSLWLRRGPQG